MVSSTYIRTVRFQLQSTIGPFHMENSNHYLPSAATSNQYDIHKELKSKHLHCKKQNEVKSTNRRNDNESAETDSNGLAQQGTDQEQERKRA